MRLIWLIMLSAILTGYSQSLAAPQGSSAPDLIGRQGVVMTEEQVLDIVSRVSPAAAAELHRRGASIVFVDMAGMSGRDARQLAWISSELPRRIGADLQKAGFKLSKNSATQNAPQPETNTYAPSVKRFDLQPAPDFIVVLSAALTSPPGTITFCIQPLSEFLSSRRCEQQQSFSVNQSIHQSEPNPALWEDTFMPYPGARLLCSQAVDDFRSGVAINWCAYVTGDPPQKVMDFYLRQEERQNMEIKEESLQIRRGNRILSVHNAFSGDYPRCKKAPGPGDKTVIITAH
jgi:hypothetical protein